MNQILAVNLSADNISLICNMIVLVLAILTLISALFGIKKGLWKSLVKLTTWAILLLVVYLFNTKFTEMYFNIDLSIFPLPNTFDFGGNDISLKQNVGGIIEDILQVYHANAGLPVITALAMSILSFVVLIVHLILCLILSPIISTILYHLILRPILGKFMKKHKLRIGGFFVNGVKTALVATCFLMPLFSTTEVLLKNYEEGIGENYEYKAEKSNEYWNMIYPFMFGYQGSLLHKLCAIITGTGFSSSYLTFDLSDGNKVNFLDFTGDFFAVACSALSTAEDASKGALITAALSSRTLDLFAEKILDSAVMLSGVIPVLCSYGIYMMSSSDKPLISKEDADKITADLEFIDFKNDLTSYLNLFKYLNEQGFVMEAVDKKTFELSRSNQVILDNALDQFKEAQDSLKEDDTKKTIIDVIVPPLLAGLVRNNSNENSDSFSLSTILPSETEAYKDYDMIELIQIFSDVLFNINDIYKSTKETDKNLTVQSIGEIQPKLLDILFSHKNVFDGAIDGRDGTRKITSLALFDGLELGNNQRDYGLLDSQLIVDRFPSVLDFALGMITNSDENAGGFTLTEDMRKEIEESTKDFDTKEEWYGELEPLVKFVSSMYNNPKLPLLNSNESGGLGPMGQIDIADEGQREELKKALVYIDESVVARTLLPSVIKETLDVDAISIFKEYDITIDDFNFTYFTEGKGIGSELSILLDSYGEIVGINLEGNFLTNKDLDTGKLKEALLGLESCEIVNPSETFEEIPLESNVFRKMMLGMFNSEDMHQIGIELSEETYDANRDRLGGEDGEISKIINILDTVKEGGLSTLLSSDSSSMSISDLKGEDIKNLVSSASESEFFRPCLSNILKKQAGPMLEENGIYLNYELMKDATETEWKEEGTSLGNLLDGLNNLVNEGDSFENIDWLEVIETKNDEVHKLLDDMVQLKMMDGELYLEETQDQNPQVATIDLENKTPLDRFGYFLIKIMKEAFPDYFKGDNGPQIEKEFSFFYHMNELKLTKNDFELSENSNPTRVDYWKVEINHLMDVFSTMKGFIVLDPVTNKKALNITGVTEENRPQLNILLLGGKSLDSEVEKEVKGINDVFVMRSILSKIVEDFFSEAKFEIEGLDSSKIYGSLLSKQYDYLSSEKETFVDSRTNEIEYRRQAISSLLSLEEQINVLTDLMNTEEELNLGSFKTQLDPIFEVLDELNKSPFTHKGRYGIDPSNTTFFEDAVALILDKSSLSTLNYDETKDSTCSDASDKTKKQILKISTLQVNNDEKETKRTWDEELKSLKEMMQAICNVESLENIQNSNAVNDLQTNDIKTLLSNLNNCYLTHDAVANLVKEVLNKTGIEDFRIDPQEQETELNYYLTSDTENKDFTTCINEWNKEITNIVSLKEAVDKMELTDGLNSMDYDNLPSIASLLEVTGASRILKPMHSDFLYSLFKNASLSDNVSKVGESSKVEFGKDKNYVGEHKEDKEKRDTIEYLSEVKIGSVIKDGKSEAWKYEGQAMDKLLNIVKGGIDLENDIQTETINTIFTSVYEYSGTKYVYASDIQESLLRDNTKAMSDMVDETKYKRAYIASEILLNFFDSNFKEYGVTYFSDIKGDYSYLCFNDYEKDGLLSILDTFSQLGNLTVESFTSGSLPTFTVEKMGPGQEKQSPLRDANKVLLKDGWNSNICYQLLNGGYLEKALVANGLINEGEKCFNMDEDMPIECASKQWPTKIKEAVLKKLGLGGIPSLPQIP